MLQAIATAPRIPPASRFEYRGARASVHGQFGDRSLIEIVVVGNEGSIKFGSIPILQPRMEKNIEEREKKIVFTFNNNLEFPFRSIEFDQVVAHPRGTR